MGIAAKIHVCGWPLLHVWSACSGQAFTSKLLHVQPGQYQQPAHSPLDWQFGAEDIGRARMAMSCPGFQRCRNLQSFA